MSLSDKIWKNQHDMKCVYWRDVKEFLDEENKLFDLLMVGEINSLEFFKRRTELLGSKLVVRGLKNGKRS